MPAGSLGQLPRPTSVAHCLGNALFDVLGHGSIRRLSEHMAGTAISGGDDGSLGYLLRSLGDIAMLNDPLKLSILKLATPCVSAVSPLSRCIPGSSWQARCQALPVAAPPHLFLSLQVVYRSSSP
jgi:hypothetical protein